MERMLAVMEPGVVYNTSSIQTRFYGVGTLGRFGYVHAGRGAGSGAMRSTFAALERRGLVERVGNGWRRKESE
jgi:hypothetical protein